MTERETGVLHEMARGLSNAEIGKRLYLSEATVKTHVTAILAKLGVRDREMGRETMASRLMTVAALAERGSPRSPSARQR